MRKKEYGHYTNQNGMMGIVGSEALRATNIKYLNDEHEFQHALDLIRKIMPETRFEQHHPDYSKYLEYIEAIEKKIQALDNYKSDSIFTVSFTEETDLLSQWRGYCPGNNGFCISIDADGIYEEACKIFNNVYLLDCVYNKEKKESDLKDLLNKHWFMFISAARSKEKEKVIDSLATEIILLASHFKHPSFSEEKEKRIVVILEYAPDNDLRFREGQFSIVPYIELPAPRSLINKIIIGPCSNKKLSKRSLEAFLEKMYGVPIFIGGPVVELSSTPYRSW
ncbi:hypothetical protein DFP85_1142 [Halomonas ventosae]|uniref:DUF2971 family protein n=1 Tax=Halomonas ventosae TaxID=229007 RepID=A0A4R6ZJ90_9GAMM|nr:DUF2971 domain-containing protein [Halomonas ventosae]TDR52029.1 hypothetical protein DFP85_1142 [Halomonas ventosae]